MINLYTNALRNPRTSKQLSFGEALVAEYTCPIKDKFTDAWSHMDYLAYVAEGRKIWHTAQGPFELTAGSCFFVRRGASILEQFFDSQYCVVLFFLADDFITKVLQSRQKSIHVPDKKYSPVIRVETNETLQAFFHSMTAYFDSNPQPDPSLIELKFKELVLTVADNPANGELLSYFSSLLNRPRSISLRDVVEENFHYNLKLEEFARLSNRSLSAFKRDFIKEFNTTPGKWLKEKRLQHARHLISNAGKTVSEAAFESGFESPSHFSRSFSSYFGVTPTTMKLSIAV